MKSIPKILSWLLVITLFVTLIVRMENIPSAYGGGVTWVLSIFFSLVFVLIGGPILTGLTYFLFKKRSFGFVFRLWASFILICLHIYFYSPPLKITIPDNFYGEINLIVVPNKEQNLNINKDGIGYVRESSLRNSIGDKKPRVYYKSGKKISAHRIMGFDSIFFYGRNSIKDMRALTFKVLPE